MDSSKEEVKALLATDKTKKSLLKKTFQMISILTSLLMKLKEESE